jgi:hypothetical protein
MSRVLPIPVLLTILLVAPPALAQSTATMLGIVSDESGAVLPGATLTARNLETGLVRTTVTSDDGSFRLPALPVGSYELRAELSGFQSALRTGLTLTVAQEAVVNFTLPVGGLAETLTVVGAATLVNTTSASLGGLVDAARIESLPLLGRNYIDLTLMQTGVTEHQNYSRGVARVGNWFSAKGATLRSNNYLLDGAMMNTLHGAGSASYSENTLGLDGIQEYRVLTSSFGAEYGMRMGSQTIMVSKSGTNTFRGSAFEFFRNEALKAKDYFDTEKPEFSRHNVGGSVGGPILTNKMFFFGTAEVVRERLGRTEIRTVIPAAAHVDGGLVPRINPIVKPFVDLFPLPNAPNDEYRFLYTQPTDEYFVQGKIDNNFSTKDSMFVRWTHNKSERTEVTSSPDFERLGFSRAHYTTLSYNRVMSPRVVNTVRASYSFTRLGIDPIAKYIGPQYSMMPGQMLGAIVPGPGIPGIGGNTTELLYGLDTLTLSDDLFHSRGRHSLKYGVLVNLAKPHVTLRNASAGTLTFASVQNFLNGGPVQNYSGASPGSVFERTYKYKTFGFYFQDDIRLGPRVTLNAGLRYEFNTVPWEINGLNSNIKDIRTVVAPELGSTFQQSSLGNFSPRLGFAWDVHGDGKTAIRGGTGLLYDIGWFNSNFVENTTGGPPFATQSRVVNAPTFTLPLNFPPESVGRVLRTVDYYSTQPKLLEYNLTFDRELPWNLGLAIAFAGSRGYNLPYTVEGNPRVPEVFADGRYFWSATAPRINPNWDDVLWKVTGARSWYRSLQVSLLKRLAQGLQFQSSYTWAKHTGDEQNAQLQGDIGDGGTSFNPNPFDRDYNRGPAQWDLRHNWKFNAIYELPGASAPGIRGALLGGWQVSTIVSLQTGYPFTAGINQPRARSGVGAGGTNIDYPDVVAGVNLSDVTKGVSRGCLGVAQGTPLGTPEMWFDPCAFAIPTLGFLGNAGRNSLRGPGFANVNLAFVKENPVGGSRRIQLRAELFNLFNRANFGMPNRIVFAGRADVEPPLGTAGRITITNGPSRQLQLSARFTF